MARIRTIKPDFFQSEDNAGLSYRARLTWVGLWTYVDDEGRCKDNARLIKGHVWPLEDEVTAVEVEKDLAELAAMNRICRYEVDGERFLEIRKWLNHQRIAKPTQSKLPPPPIAVSNDSGKVSHHYHTPPEECHTTTTPLPVGKEVEVEGEEEVEQGRGKRATRIPPDFTITPEMRQYAATKTPDVNIDLATEKFINHWTAASGSNASKRDWTATWRNWMLSDQERAGRATQPRMDHSARGLAKGMAMLQAYDAQQQDTFALEA